MRISDWSSDVCSSDLGVSILRLRGRERPKAVPSYRQPPRAPLEQVCGMVVFPDQALRTFIDGSILTMDGRRETPVREPSAARAKRSEEHTSELQSLMRISYDVFCLKNNILLHTITTT